MKKRSYRLTVLALAALVALLVIGTIGAAPKDGLTVSVSAAQTDFTSSQDVLVTVTFSNPTRHTLRILSWFAAADGLEEPIFTVARDGQPVSYVGAHYKRPAATRSDYLSLKSGESIVQVVDLGEFYDLSGTGRYEIAYSVAAQGLFDEKSAASAQRDALVSAPINVKVEGRGKGKPPPPPPPPPGSGNTTFTACSTTQQSQLIAARNAATTYASNALGYMNVGTSGARYSTWFGIYLDARYSTVKTNFGEISRAMDAALVNFNCSSKRNVYAYVYPNDPYKIYLGRVYWSAPAIGTDSQAGTLIHEMSHFTVVAGTDDVVYGQTGAKNLAISDPDGAVRNADSHEYFAENDPFLP